MIHWIIFVLSSFPLTEKIHKQKDTYIYILYVSNLLGKLPVLHPVPHVFSQVPNHVQDNTMSCRANSKLLWPQGMGNLPGEGVGSGMLI